MLKARELILKMDPEERERYCAEYKKELRGNLIRAAITVLLFTITLLVILVVSYDREWIDMEGTFFFAGYASGICILGLILMGMAYWRVNDEYGPPNEDEMKELGLI